MTTEQSRADERVAIGGSQTPASPYASRSSATAIRFPPELHERLRQASAEYGLSINYLVVKACEDFLPRMIPVAELRLTR